MMRPFRLLPLLLLAAADLAVAADSSAPGNPSNLVRLGGHWYLSAHHEAVGQELWRTDGTTAGTFFLNDLGGMFNARRFLRANGFVYFLAEGDYVSVNLWRTDGTPEGTAFLRQLHPGGKYGSFPPAPRFESFVFRGELFTPAQGPEGIELWKADSTGEPRLFMDFNPGAESSHPEQFFVDSERFFFVTGTVRVVDLRPGALGSHPEVHVSAGQLFFAADDGVTGRELYISDGTAEGTRRVYDFNGPTAPVVPQLPGDGGTEEEDEKHGCSVAGSGAALPLLALVLTGLGRHRRGATVGRKGRTRLPALDSVRTWYSQSPHTAHSGLPR